MLSGGLIKKPSIVLFKFFKIKKKKLNICLSIEKRYSTEIKKKAWINSISLRFLIKIKIVIKRILHLYLSQKLVTYFKNITKKIRTFNSDHFQANIN
jgi:hypothetical protein